MNECNVRQLVVSVHSLVNFHKTKKSLKIVEVRLHLVAYTLQHGIELLYINLYLYID